MLQILGERFPCREYHGGAGGYFLKELWPVEEPQWNRFILWDCSLWRRR